MSANAPTPKNRPVGRYLDLKAAKSKATARAYTTSIKQFFWHVDGEPIRRAVKARTANDEEAIRALDARAAEYLAEVRAGDRSAPDDVLDFIAAMGREEYSPSTIHNARAAVVGFLDLHKVGLDRQDERNIKAALPRSQVVAEEVDVTLPMLRAIIPHLGPHHRAAALCCLASGCRAGEALKLRLRDVDLTAEPPTVRFPRAITKSKKSRVSFLTDEAADALRAWIAVRDDYLVEANGKMKNLVAAGRASPKRMDDDRIFCFEPSAFYRGWNHAVEAAGLFERCEETGRAKVRVHGLRKAFRSLLGVAAGGDIAEVLLGHDPYLAGVYRHIPEETLRKAYAEHCHVLETRSAGTAELKREVSTIKAENEALRARLADLEATRAEWMQVENPPKAHADDPEFVRAVARAVATLQAGRA